MTRDPADAAAVVARRVADGKVAAISGTEPPTNDSVRAASSASQNEAKRTPVSCAADSEIVRSSSSRSRAPDMRWLIAGQRADALGLHALGLVEAGVADGDARLGGEQPQRLLLLGVGQALGQDVVEHAHEGVADVDRHAVVRGRGPLLPPLGRQRARVLQRAAGSAPAACALDDEARAVRRRPGAPAAARPTRRRTAPRARSISRAASKTCTAASAPGRHGAGGAARCAA